MRKKINLSIFLNGQRGVEVLKKILKIKDYKVISVIISKKFLKENVREFLIENKTQFKYFEKTSNTELKKIHKNIDVGIIAGFPFIIKNDLLKTTNFGFLNCHAGLLPYYRGGSPLNWQIINNEKKFGITVIKANAGIDKGNIICQKKFNLSKDLDINDLHDITNSNFPNLVVKSIKKIITGFKGIRQKENLARYYPQRKPKDTKIKLENINYKNLKLLYRALKKPYPNVYFLYRKKKINLNNLSLSQKKLQPGKVIFQRKFIHFGCLDKTLQTKLI
jgi:methionyl-tRNA formyltransferase